MLEVNRSRYYGIAVITFILFGFSPIYWSWLSSETSLVILFHRTLWTLCILMPLSFYKNGYKTIFSVIKKQGHYLALSAFFIAVNWLTYIFAVNNNHVFEASLAYFIAPLLSVGLSSLFLREALTKNQKIAVSLASIALGYLLIAKQVFPKYAFIIALTFSLYGLMSRKIQTTIFIRMLIESILILTFLSLFLQSPQEILFKFLKCDFSTQALLVLSGAVTMLPMSMYVFCVKKLPFSIVGILSFILPTIVFIIGILYFHQQIDRDKLITMLMIWLSIGIYIVDLRRKASLIPTTQEKP